MNLSSRRTRKRKDEILKSAMRIINTRGYEAATMEEIAAELLMTKGSLYYYFKNKQDLMYQCHHLVLSEAVKELEEHLEKDQSVTETLKNMVDTHIYFAVEEKETYNLLIRPDQAYDKEHLQSTLDLRKYYASLFDKLIERGIASGEFSIKEPVIARMFILGSMNWIQQWFYPDNRLTREQLQQLFYEYILTLLRGSE